ncbi:hypothetical protein [Streptomyces pristinaespiralis]|uniref:hypothetical protein n=1 Tax=Streptomyces pristinaespiralis TaxID=38300 RepID=UPI0033DE0011
MTDPAPLEHAEEVLWRGLMRLLVTVPRVMSDDLERPAGLIGSECMVLVHLSEVMERRLRTSDLADRTGLSPSRITRVVEATWPHAGCFDATGAPTRTE